MSIEVGIQYTTRNGNQARIYATDHDNRDGFPVAGAIKIDGFWRSFKWTKHGNWTANPNILHDNDLIETKTIKGWAVTLLDDTIIFYQHEPHWIDKPDNIFSIIPIELTTHYQQGLS